MAIAIPALPSLKLSVSAKAWGPGCAHARYIALLSSGLPHNLGFLVAYPPEHPFAEAQSSITFIMAGMSPPSQYSNYSTQRTAHMNFGPCFLIAFSKLG